MADAGPTRTLFVTLEWSDWHPETSEISCSAPLHGAACTADTPCGIWCIPTVNAPLAESRGLEWITDDMVLAWVSVIGLIEMCRAHGGDVVESESEGQPRGR